MSCKQYTWSWSAIVPMTNNESLKYWKAKDDPNMWVCFNSFGPQNENFQQTHNSQWWSPLINIDSHGRGWECAGHVSNISCGMICGSKLIGHRKHHIWVSRNFRTLKWRYRWSTMIWAICWAMFWDIKDKSSNGHRHNPKRWGGTPGHPPFSIPFP